MNAFLEEGDKLTMLLGGIRRFTKYAAAGLLRAKRQLADAAMVAEKFVDRVEQRETRRIYRNRLI